MRDSAPSLAQGRGEGPAPPIPASRDQTNLGVLKEAMSLLFCFVCLKPLRWCFCSHKATLKMAAGGITASKDRLVLMPEAVNMWNQDCPLADLEGYLDVPHGITRVLLSERGRSESLSETETENLCCCQGRWETSRSH